MLHRPGLGQTGAMNETLGDEMPPPPPPPPGEPAAPFRLRRSNSDRMIAGVSGGVAEYFAIDPIVVRLGFLALFLLGGSGIPIYLIAWLVMPAEHEEESAALNALRGGHRPGGRSLLAIALLIFGIVLFSGSLFWLPVFDGALFLPLLVLAAGIALLVWPDGGLTRGERGSAERTEWHDERTAMRDEWRRERNEWRASRSQWRHGYRRGFTGDDTDPPAATAETPRRRRRRRPPPFLGPLGLAALLAFGGLTVLAERLDWWKTNPAEFFAGCLLILGVVLVISAFIGRARGLIFLGLLLLPIAWTMSVADLEWWDGIGEEGVNVTSLDDLEDEYRWGIGEFHVNLADLDLDGETRELAIGLTIGELKIYVPQTMGVEIDLDGRVGSVLVTDRDLLLEDDGVDIALDRTAGDPAGGTLLLDVDLGIGEAEVIICGSQAVPCP